MSTKKLAGQYQWLFMAPLFISVLPSGLITFYAGNALAGSMGINPDKAIIYQPHGYLFAMMAVGFFLVLALAIALGLSLLVIYSILPSEEKSLGRAFGILRGNYPELWMV